MILFCIFWDNLYVCVYFCLLVDLYLYLELLRARGQGLTVASDLTSEYLVRLPLKNSSSAFWTLTRPMCRCANCCPVWMTMSSRHILQIIPLFDDCAEDDLDVDCDAHLCNMRRRLQQVPAPLPQALSTPCPAPRQCLEMFTVRHPCSVDSWSL